MKIKKLLLRPRVGHGEFKEILLKSRANCELCGLNNSNFLIASHIKPWSISDEKEKVDSNKGLLLCPHHDSLFDKGYISFDNNGHIIRSTALDERTRILMKSNNIGIHSESPKGWKKELNLISWNDKEPKYDIREWSPDHEKMGKSVILMVEELKWGKRRGLSRLLGPFDLP